MGDKLKNDIVNLIVNNANYYINNAETAHLIADGCIDEIMDLIDDKIEGCFTEN